MVKNSAMRSLRTVGFALTTLLITGGLAVQPAVAGDNDIIPSPPQSLRPALEVATDQFIVGLRDNVKAAAAAATAEQAADRAATKLGVAAESAHQNAAGGQVIKLGKALSGATAEQFLKTLRADPNVAYAEADDIMQVAADPNDAYYSTQWDLSEDLAGIRPSGAWQYNHGEGVVVAVVDSGITSHPDLNANVLPGYDMKSDAADARDGNGRDADPTDPGDWSTANECGVGSPQINSSWHGTHVAGTIAAIGNNATGVTGVAPKAKILPVRALGACGGYTSDIADSIIWAAGGVVAGAPINTNPARVINLSLGGIKPCSATYQNAINFAYNAGAAVVVAAGNSNRPAADSSPANCQNVITVAASDRTGAKASYSNYGSVVDVTAPGGEMSSSALNGILSTYNSGTTTQGTPGYAFMQGTSMAAPHVAGLAALLYSAEGITLTPEHLEQQLKQTSRPLPAGCSAGCGAGLIDATAALTTFGGHLPVTPAAVVFIDRDGTSNDTYTIPTSAGVEYLVGGKVLAAGTYAGSGSVTVTARALTNYSFALAAAAEWKFTFKTSTQKITDFDGDGKSDVLARDTAGVLWLYPGNGSGGWLPARKIGAGWNAMTSIESPGDFNGDGKMDVIARDANGVLWLYPGNGSGGWFAARQIGTGWNGMAAIEAPGDFNGDGKADVIARDANGVLWLYPGNGSGGWLAARQIGSGWNVMTAIDGPGDFDGDGKADVLARNSSGVLWLYPGNGTGGWLAARQIGSGWNVMTAMEGPGDFDGDGKVDVVARNGSGVLWLYPGDGSGGWLAARQIGSGWNVMTAIV